jgi:hypothetical protein
MILEASQPGRRDGAKFQQKFMRTLKIILSRELYLSITTPNILFSPDIQKSDHFQ